MTAASTPESMRSRGSHSLAVEVKEPRKNGSRGGKRSVIYLSKAQLARKRANDREAQRNTRQRTKEHIESLEKKVEELEAGGQSSSMERVLKRNEELEAEIEKLRAQMPSAHSIPSQIPSKISDELFAQAKHEPKWMPVPWPDTAPLLIPALNLEADSQVSMAIPASTYSNHGPIYPTTSSLMGCDHDLYTLTVASIWEDPLVFRAQQSQSLPKSTPTWAPFHPAFD